MSSLHLGRIWGQLPVRVSVHAGVCVCVLVVRDAWPKLHVLFGKGANKLNG